MIGSITTLLLFQWMSKRGWRGAGGGNDRAVVDFLDSLKTSVEGKMDWKERRKEEKIKYRLELSKRWVRLGCSEWPV